VCDQGSTLCCIHRHTHERAYYIMLPTWSSNLTPTSNHSCLWPQQQNVFSLRSRSKLCNYTIKNCTQFDFPLLRSLCGSLISGLRCEKSCAQISSISLFWIMKHNILPCPLCFQVWVLKTEMPKSLKTPQHISVGMSVCTYLYDFLCTIWSDITGNYRT
jgi:hypothetical protein